MSIHSKPNKNDDATKEEQIRILNAIQTYSVTAMQIKDRLDFFRLTVTAATKIFNLPKFFILDINPKTKIVSFVDYVSTDVFQQREIIGQYPKSVENLAMFVLDKTPLLKDFFEPLKLNNALVFELIRTELDYSGLFIYGFEEREGSVKTIPEYKLKLFKVFAEKASLINYLLRQNERLSQELEERKKIEKVIEKQAIELKRSNEDLEQFAYVISHDLKAPLRNITSFSQLLKRKVSKDISNEAKEYLDFILTGVKQFRALIDDLLLYSRAVKEGIELKAIKTELVIEAAKYNLRVLIEETEAVIIYENLPELNINFSQMTQVFQNLISNAIKFRQKGVAPVITITADSNHPEYVLFEVVDNGIGIEKQYFTTIFSLFQRLHTQFDYEGTGLGLSICKKIIERHKGSISVKSEGLNKGTNFYFTIPK